MKSDFWRLCSWKREQRTPLAQSNEDCWMPNRSCSRITGLFAIAGMLSGCASFSSGSDLRMVYSTEGLGTSPIGAFYARKPPINSESGLRDKTMKFIMAQISGKRLSRKEAEISWHTVRAAAKYGVHLLWRILVPNRSPSAGISPLLRTKNHRKHNVRFSYLKPQQLSSKVREHDIPRNDEVKLGRSSV